MASAARPTLSDAAASAWPAPNASAITQGSLLALGMVRTMSPPRADGSNPAHHPMGTERIQRQATALRSLYRVRIEGRDFAASGMGRCASRLSAISDTG